MISQINNLTLSEYCAARKHYCDINHSAVCKAGCSSMIQAAQMVLDGCIVPMSVVFKKAFPVSTYLSSNAKRRLLQMPLAALRISKSKHQSDLYLMEKIDGFNYEKLVEILHLKAVQMIDKGNGISRDELKQLMAITQTEREKELIRYAVYKSSNVTSSQARRLFGFENVHELSHRIQVCIQQTKEIYEAVNDLAIARCEAVIETYDHISSSSDDDDTSDPQGDSSDRGSFRGMLQPLPDTNSLVSCLKESNFNWFPFRERIGAEHDEVSQCIENFFEEIPLLQVFTPSQLDLIVQSHRAFNASVQDSYEDERIARIINGEVVSDSESDDPEDYVAVQNSRKARNDLIEKKQKAIKRWANRKRVKALAEKRFLSRKASKRTSKILLDCPKIGQTIESFVQDHQIGADAWRRTGVLTFDGNTKIKNKVTYQKIQEHLQVVYNRKISFGSVVELCVARNKRRCSSKRYRGLAQVTSRRARKGFNLKYNPDTHWSASLYKGLNELQYKDGRNMLVINRDDAAGFRLDTLTTCKQYKNPTVIGKSPLTTRTDYVNKYSSTLQTTSYNFTATATTSEFCVGIVKAIPIHKKSPMQHFCDLIMLSEKAELQPVFKNCDTGLEKEIDCIRVDGASDEGPSHESVQFWWAVWHYEKAKVATMMTTRCSGSSYLNRVELQNGCLSLGHSNTFIPSTLGGSCVNQETGEIDDTKLKRNLQLAIAAYIDRVDGCPMGETSIRLYEGSTSCEYVSIASKLDVFLKGSKKQKKLLQETDGTLYSYMSKIWDIRIRHSVHGLPSSYMFYLRCCYQPGCEHPVCQSHQPTTLDWYPGGPSLSQIPMPLSDVARPWGKGTCSSCQGSFCSGHYLNKLFLIDANSNEINEYSSPPSVILKQKFMCCHACGQDPKSDGFLREAAESVLLGIDDVKIWMNHLITVIENRKRGAAKAVITRRRNQVHIAEKVPEVENRVESNDKPKSQDKEKCIRDDENFCGKCRKEYLPESGDNFWIGCDVCDRWFCCTCEGLSSQPSSETYICKTCRCS